MHDGELRSEEGHGKFVPRPPLNPGEQGALDLEGGWTAPRPVQRSGIPASGVWTKADESGWAPMTGSGSAGASRGARVTAAISAPQFWLRALLGFPDGDANSQFGIAGTLAISLDAAFPPPAGRSSG